MTRLVSHMPVELWIRGRRIEELTENEQQALRKRITEVSRRALQAGVNENIDLLILEARERMDEQRRPADVVQKVNDDA